jgi:hypothetical protein
MNVQGSQVLNIAAIDALIAKVNAVKSPLDLQACVDQAMAPINAQLVGVQAKIDELAPWLELLDPPTSDPVKLATWIAKLIGVNIAPQVKAYYYYTNLLAQLPARIALLESAITHAAQRVASVHVTIPIAITLPPVVEDHL